MFYVYLNIFFVFYCCVFVGVKTSTYKYDAFFFSKLRWALFSISNIQYVPREDHGYRLQWGEHWVGEQTVTLWTAIQFYVFMHVFY